MINIQHIGVLRITSRLMEAGNTQTTERKDSSVNSICHPRMKNFIFNMDESGDCKSGLAEGKPAKIDPLLHSP